MTGLEAFLLIVLPMLIGLFIVKYSKFIERTEVMLFVVVSSIPIINWVFIIVMSIQHSMKHHENWNNKLANLINKK